MSTARASAARTATGTLDRLEGGIVFRGFRGRFPAWLKGAVALFILGVLLAGSPKGAFAELVKVWPRNMADLESYYQIEDLDHAAKKLRQDALTLGHDIHQYRESGDSAAGLYPLHLPAAKILPDANDHSYIDLLKDKHQDARKTRMQAAILAVKRELTIDEVASLFESGIRILQNLFAGPSPQVFGGLLVLGRPADLLALQGQEYYSWLGEYGPALKMQSGLGPSSLNWYTIFLFNRRVEPSFLEDLESLNVEVRGMSESFRTIGVKCSWEKAKRVLELNWVRCMLPKEHPIDL